MHTCKWCNLAQELSGNAAAKCRPCYRRKRKIEAARKQRQVAKAR